jgi:hypothetical protein
LRTEVQHLLYCNNLDDLTAAEQAKASMKAALVALRSDAAAALPELKV